MNMDDESIIKLLLCHNESGLEHLLKQYGKLLRYVINGILKNTLDADDCYNEVCLCLWQKANTFEANKSSLSTWLTVVARNMALNRLKANFRRESHFENFVDQEYIDENTPESAALKKELDEKLESAICALSYKDKQLIYRKYFYLQSIAQIAAELGMTERAIEGKYYRLRKRLEKYLGGEKL